MVCLGNGELPELNTARNIFRVSFSVNWMRYIINKGGVNGRSKAIYASIPKNAWKEQLLNLFYRPLGMTGTCSVAVNGEAGT